MRVKNVEPHYWVIIECIVDVFNVSFSLLLQLSGIDRIAKIAKNKQTSITGEMKPRLQLNK